MYVNVTFTLANTFLLVHPCPSEIQVFKMLTTKSFVFCKDIKSQDNSSWHSRQVNTLCQSGDSYRVDQTLVSALPYLAYNKC